MRRLVWLYPRRWRDRYGRELVELLDVSQRPWRDSVNVLVHAALVWLEVPVVKLIVIVAAPASLMLFGFSVGQLADGVREVPHHWWSSASAALTFLAVTAALISAVRTRRTGGA
jgi:hypothetical protein